MDKGAHFHRCDFQVHTPRDPQWKGGEVVTEIERQAYAAAFIIACREKGLNAVAITDHHDMVFVRYIRDAAMNELGADGKPVPESERIVVFPAMELTLAVPCQAILIFDADFPEDMFQLAMNALAISQNPPADSKNKQATRLELYQLSEVCKKLNAHDYLRGRYILLPNVSEGGKSTLLRPGHALHYREMPCVGGYLDGSCDQIGKGNRSILSGRASEYGQKRLALFQTSDNRDRAFTDLCQHSTWVKWATPSAEALRQACLAQESRISQTPPPLPSVYITSISVSNSLFMGPVDLSFNRQYNAIIGGRGTGKSTILEYLRWGVCDQPPALEDADAVGNLQSKRKALIARTLTAHSSVVQVRFSVNGVEHTVRRHSQTNELTLKIGEGEFTLCSEADIQSLLPVQAYSQKQLSNVGVRIEELDRLIRTPIRQQLADLEARLNQLANELKTLHTRIQRTRVAQKDIEKDELEAQSLEQQVNGLRAGLTGFSEEDQKLIGLQQFFEREDDLVQGWLQDVTRLEKALGEPVRVAADGPLNSTEPDADLPNARILNEMGVALRAIYADVKSAVDAAVARIRRSESDTDPFQTTYLRWSALNKEFREKYEAAKARSTSHDTQIQQLGVLEGRIRDLRKSLTLKRAALSAITGSTSQFRVVRDQWLNLLRRRSDILAEQSAVLTKLSGGQIRATLQAGVGVGAAQEKFKSLLVGLNIRSNKLESLFDAVERAADPLAEWELVVSELEALAVCDPSDPTTGALPKAAKLTEAGFTDADIGKICGRLNPETWLDLSLVSLTDVPKFEYKTRENQYIAFADASAGQQATALLSALLNQDGPPLIVDQPEDDLDNQVILKVVEQIWQAKQKRQLIFSSHNANLVVNGDAELVICCDYRTAADQSGGMVKREGAIDITAIRQEITTVMEGGHEAFKLRKEKYGF